MKKYWPIILILMIAFLIRLPYLSKFPNGLNADEAAIGYNAWSLIHTGKDEHGVSWPLVFRSFDDYKPPLYFYLVLPLVKIFGLTIDIVRLPSAFFGSLSVLIVYLLVKKLLPSKSEFVALISAVILALSPWHILFSRGAWEVNISTFLILLGIYFFVIALKRPLFYLFFTLSFILSLYCYHSARVIVPLLILSLLIIYRQKTLSTRNHLKFFAVSFFLGILLALPVGFQLLSKEGQSRFSGVSIFADSGPLSYVLEMRRTSSDPNSLLTKIRYNRYSIYAQKFVENYLSHFHPNFLFINGDVIDRSRVVGFGQSYLFLLPFFYFGILLVLLNLNSGNQIILSWLLISPIAASLTYQSPHALRAENMVIPLSIITAIGIEKLIFFTKNKKWQRVSSLCFLGLFSFYSVNFYRAYTIETPKQLPIAWESGFSELSKYLKANYNKYDHIIVSDRYDQPYILVAFFTQYPPDQLQKELVFSNRDNFGFSTGRAFGKYEFRKIDYLKDKNLKNTLIVATEEVVPNDKVIGGVKSITGQYLFKFISTNEK